MALAATNIWAIDAAATAANVNGGFFNPSNANFLTDYTATLANTAAPVLANAGLAFDADDVGAWVYVKAGTNCLPGFYPIDSVADGDATLDAGVGSGVVYFRGRWVPSTVAGIATVASPTGITCGIDYSQRTAAIITDTDLACADGDVAGAVVTSAAKPFNKKYVGNGMKVTDGTGYTVDWYEVVNVTGDEATLDKAVGTDGAKTDGTFYVGGAISLGHTSDDSVFEKGIAGNVFFQKGDVVLGGTVTPSVNGSGTLSIEWEGFSAIRGDDPIGGDMPFITVGSTTLSTGLNWKIRNLDFANAAEHDAFVCVTLQQGSVAINCKASNPSAQANRAAWYLHPDAAVISCEGICTNGRAVNTDGTAAIINCYLHDSQTGARLAGTSLGHVVIGCLIETCSGIGISFGSANTLNSLVMNNTIYRGETPGGTAGIFFTAGCTDMRVINNIIYGWATGVSHGTAGYTHGVDMFNAYYNNTTNATNWNIDKTSKTTAITFANAAAGDFTPAGAPIGAGAPGVFPGATVTSYNDIGAIQTRYGAGQAIPESTSDEGVVVLGARGFN